jgi:hypothetical protein
MVVEWFKKLWSPSHQTSSKRLCVNLMDTSWSVSRTRMETMLCRNALSALTHTHCSSLSMHFQARWVCVGVNYSYKNLCSYKFLVTLLLINDFSCTQLCQWLCVCMRSLQAILLVVHVLLRTFVHPWWSSDSMLAIEPKIHGFNPGGGQKNLPRLPSESHQSHLIRLRGMLKNPTSMREILRRQNSADISCKASPALTLDGNCQRASVNKSGMMRNQVGTHNRSEMVAVQ